MYKLTALNWTLNYIYGLSMTLKDFILYLLMVLPVVIIPLPINSKPPIIVYNDGICPNNISANIIAKTGSR